MWPSGKCQVARASLRGPSARASLRALTSTASSLFKGLLLDYCGAAKGLFGDIMIIIFFMIIIIVIIVMIVIITIITVNQ